MRIGVAGLNAAGKGEVVRFLERRSFHAASLSDVIRRELATDGLEGTREHMIVRGRELRARFGAAWDARPAGLTGCAAARVDALKSFSFKYLKP